MSVAAPSFRRRMRLGDWGLLVLLASLLGGNYLGVEVAIREITPPQVALLRQVFGVLFFAPFLLVARIPLPLARHAHHYLVVGCCTVAAPLTLLATAQLFIPLGLASVLTATGPAFAAAFAHAMTEDEKISTLQACGIIASACGCAFLFLLSLNGAVFAAEQREPAWLGVLLALAASASLSFSIVYARRLRALGIRAPTLAFGQMAASFVFLVPLAALAAANGSPVPLGELAPLTWSVLVGSGMGASALGYFIYFRLLQNVGAVNLSLTEILIPVFALLAAAALFREIPSPLSFIGFALILLGFALIDGRLFTRPRRTALALEGGATSNKTGDGI